MRLLPRRRRHAATTSAARAARRRSSHRRGVLQGAAALPHRRHARARRSSTCSQLDLGDVEPSMAGPKRPQDRLTSPSSPASSARRSRGRPRRRASGSTDAHVEATGRFTAEDGTLTEIRHGDVVIAAITSCTNTSNPSVMLAAGLLAKKAVERGLRVQAVRQDEPRPGQPRGHGVPRRGGAHAVPRPAGLPARRLRLHHLHRQLGPAARRGAGGGDRGRPDRGRRALGQPQLRGAHPPAT